MLVITHRIKYGDDKITQMMKNDDEITQRVRYDDVMITR